MLPINSKYAEEEEEALGTVGGKAGAAVRGWLHRKASPRALPAGPS